MKPITTCILSCMTASGVRNLTAGIISICEREDMHCARTTAPYEMQQTHTFP